LLLLASAPAVAASSSCAVADVEEPFELPDGSWHPAGQLTLCFERENTPVSFFHRTYVNRMPIGIFAAGLRVLATSEGDDTRSFLFTRGEDRTLRLSGYSVPLRDRIELYEFDRPRVEVHDSLRAESRSPRESTRFIRIDAALI
jgi:hypothetical protein